MTTQQIARLGLVLFSILLLISSSCALIPIASQQENDSGTIDQPSGGEPEPPAAAENSEEGALLGCFDVRAYTLSVDHTLTITETETSLTHILHHGGIALQTSQDTDKGDCSITTAAPMTISYEYMGVVGPCSVDAEGEVIFSAVGYCEDGIVYLTITEDWQPTSGTMVCDDTPVNFPIAGYTAVHSGQSGLGEEFLITEDVAGFTVMREFQGGEGYHSWTLAYDIELAPLTPED